MIGTRKFRTKEARARERIRIFAYGVVASIVVLLLSLGAIYVLKLEMLQIRDVQVETNGALDTKEVAAWLWDELHTSMFGLVARTNTLLLHTGALEERLKEQFPRIQNVYVHRIGFTTLQARIVEREPAALWCGDVVPPIAYMDSATRMLRAEESWGTCFLVDEGGFIYARSPIYTGSLFPRYYGSLETAEPLGQQLLVQKKFVRWQQFFEILEDYSFEPVALLFVDDRDVEFYLGNGLRVLAGREDDTHQIVRRLSASLEAEAIDLQRNIEYVDLRFGAKVFIRYVDEEENSPAETNGVVL